MRTPTCQACSGKSRVPRAPLYWFHHDVLDRRRTLGIGGDEVDRRGQRSIRIVQAVGPSAPAGPLETFLGGQTTDLDVGVSVG